MSITNIQMELKIDATRSKAIERIARSYAKHASAKIAAHELGISKRTLCRFLVLYPEIKQRTEELKAKKAQKLAIEPGVIDEA
jgi:hypothetical protein